MRSHNKKYRIIGLCDHTQNYLDSNQINYDHSQLGSTLTEIMNKMDSSDSSEIRGVYVSEPNHHLDTHREIKEFDMSICEKLKIKSIYFVVFNDKSETNNTSNSQSNIHLVQYLPSGSQIYEIYGNVQDAAPAVRNLIERFSSHTCLSNKNGFTTFVTAIVDIYDENHVETNTKKLDFRIEQFKYMAKTNIPICVYVCDHTRPYIENLVKEGYYNIKIMDENYKNLDIVSIIFSQKDILDLPDIRTKHKDTFEYLTLMHSKMDLIKNAMDHNFWHHDNFAWVDFNVMHVGKTNEDKVCMQHFLCEISQFSPDHFHQIVVPGCWNKGFNIDNVLRQIHWRFCGGFFIGNREALNDFYELYTIFLPEFLAANKTMVWEVNFWAWLEYYKNWNPMWYEADHNRKILQIPQISHKYHVLTLHDKSDVVSIFEYVEREHYVPSSSSYIYFEGHHLLNVRYVNYMMDDGGYYHYRDNSGIIKTQNYLCHLDVDIVPTLKTDLGGWMSEKNIDLPKHKSFSQGLEDIRLYEFNGQLRFVATTIEYYNTNGARIMIGNYCHRTMSYNDVKIIDSPKNSFFEKNWAPICGEKELFIYSWNPLTIGEIIGNQLNLLFSHDLTHIPLLQRCKGSTSFLKQPDTNTYLGLVHYSEDTSPRTYYHILVELDENYFPIKMSNPFVFFKQSIEFCIGMIVKSHHFVFFISQMDRSPVNMMVHKDALALYATI